MLHIAEPNAPFEPLLLPLAQEKGVQLFLKREDLSDEHISGNKWRKLKYHLIAAYNNHKKILVTFGGAYSNHLMATAAAGQKYGFSTFAFVRGEEVSNYILEKCLGFGMHLQFVSRTSYREKEVLFQSVFGLNQEAYFIPEGGGGDLGEKGVAEMITMDGGWDKLVQDSVLPLHIVTSVGTGATMRGILQGITNKKLNILVNGVVILKGAESMINDFNNFENTKFTLHHAYHFGGYAKTTATLTNYQKKFASQTGILLDHVYEAKMMWAIEDLLTQNYFKPGTTVVAIHNGGTWNLSQMLFG